ncbi:MAG TPA: PIN domain-containing protein, partial [Candidatus Acidoferrum sp.]|nr:PIN domain-containing protein [Candidatus Acidoferrum sp.]
KRDRAAFLQTLSSTASLAVCAIVMAELYAGFSNEETGSAGKFLATVDYVCASREATELAGQMMHRYKRRGIGLALQDTIIAAIAISEGYTLVTDNVQDFPMPELKLLAPPRN